MPVGNPITDISSAGNFVPITRTLTINGVVFDLSANRSWTITAIDVGAVPTTRTLTINDVAFDLSANRSFSVGDYGTW